MVKYTKLHLNNDQHYIYSPGSVVEGSLEVSVDKPKDYIRIIVELWGGASVSWTESSGSGENRSSTTYQYSEPYFNPKIEVWKAEASPTGQLPIGVHTFPFSFHLPQDIPSSFHTVTGQIKYEIEARIMKNRKVIQNNRAIKALLKVENRTPRTDILSLYAEPVTASKTKRLTCLFWQRGSITATVNLPRTGFSPGEVIPITVDVCNESSKKITIAFVLKRRDVFTSLERNHESKNISENVIARTLSSPIMPGTTITFVENDVIVPINAATTIRDCSCISAEYTLEVIIRVHYYLLGVFIWSLNQSVKIPLTIAYGAPSDPVTEPRPFGLRPQHPVAPQPPHNPVAALTTTTPPSYNEAIGF